MLYTSIRGYPPLNLPPPLRKLTTFLRLFFANCLWLQVWKNILYHVEKSAVILWEFHLSVFDTFTKNYYIFLPQFLSMSTITFMGIPIACEGEKKILS